MIKTFISGLGFHKVSKWSICPRYQQSWNPSEVKENDLVFLNYSYFIQFLKLLHQDPPSVKFRLILHNSDHCFGEIQYRMIEPFINHIYSINTIFRNEKITTIPLGYRDSPYDTMEILRSIPFKQEKTIPLYMNFELNTNMEKRTECKKHFENESWVVQEGFLKKDALPLPEFYQKMATSKYILSPEGTGIDCHRVYEAIYYNAIPIMKTNPMAESFYKNLPIWIVNDWSEITKESLEADYEERFAQLVEWKRTNPNWLYPEFWLL